MVALTSECFDHALLTDNDVLDLSTLVRAQMLSELEEIIMFKQYADQPERQQAMRKTWMKRYGLRPPQFFGSLEFVVQTSRLST